MYILALGDEKCRLNCPTAPQKPQDLESPSEKADMREAPCDLGTAIPYHGQPFQLGQNTTVVLVPHKVLAKMLNSTGSFSDVRHPFVTLGLSFSMGFPSSSGANGVLAPCGIRQGAERQPGLRASTLHLAGCALDAEAYVFIANLSGSLEKLTQPKKTLENPAERISKTV